MMDPNLLSTVKDYATTYLNELPRKRAFPADEQLIELEKLKVPLPDTGKNPKDVIDILNNIGSPNTVASTGARYFGFVFGGSLPASLAANWLAAAWDQNASFKISSPIAAQIEQVTSQWLLDLLQLPSTSAVGFDRYHYGEFLQCICCPV
jgi:glutamate/tyrosine decarboxylase-like PLP-dependent enzyme